MENTHSSEFELDVRALTRLLRHRLIFQALDALAPGQTLRLINDHDPSPLSFQLHNTIGQAVQRALLRVPGVARSEVELVWDPPWTPLMITDAGRRELGGA
jgi:uncharacterized protein (DUF2249 family)